MRTRYTLRLVDRMLERSLVEDAMRRALTLARRGPAGNVNPQVGCVILDPGGRIVAEGWHEGAGTLHAEPSALAQLPAPWRARSAELTAVVTLEPCNHTGRTGPCTDTLIDSGIGAVAYALPDPGDAASGGGSRLRAAGVQVLPGVLASEARVLLAEWLDRQPAVRAAVRAADRTAPVRPRVTVKWAQTLDGRAAAADGSSQWITGPAARADVHRRRAESDAILIGTGTLLADDPTLTARAPDGSLLVPAAAQPIPVVLGHREIPEDARLRAHPALAAHGLAAPIRLAGDDLGADLAELRTADIRTVFVEGGPAIVSALLSAGLVDDVLVYVTPALLGGPRLAIGDLGIPNISGIRRLTVTETLDLTPDLLIRAAFSDPHPSPKEIP